MNDPHAHTRDDDGELSKAELEADVLITRLVDGETTGDDRERFNRMAEARPEMWRRLALRQQDMTLLTARVNHQLKSVDQIELPAATGPVQGRMNISARLPWLVALTGMAAALVFGAAWLGAFQGGVKSTTPSNSQLVPAGGSPDTLTADEHLRQYLKAGFVIGELPPTLLQVDEMSDGRKAARILRRIEEVIILPGDQDVPVDEQGALTTPPDELRGDDARPAHRD